MYASIVADGSGIPSSSCTMSFCAAITPILVTFIVINAAATDAAASTAIDDDNDIMMLTPTRYCIY